MNLWVTKVNQVNEKETFDLENPYSIMSVTLKHYGKVIRHLFTHR